MSDSGSSTSGNRQTRPAIDEIGDFDVDDLDLPPVDHIPTVEEILREDGDSSGLGLDDLPEETYAFDESSSDVTSLASSTPRDLLKKKDWRKPSRKKTKSAILRCVKLRQVSAFVSSASAEHLNVGSATALTASSAFLAVGTSHSVVLVFDIDQRLKYTLGHASNTLDYANVSALDISRDSTRLLVGFAKGQIQMFDLTNGRLLRALTAEATHAVGPQSVLGLRFTNDNAVALCIDAGGNVFELAFTRKLSGTRGVDSRCIFSGCKGEVATLAPLVLPAASALETHASIDALICAMASFTKVIVVRLRPRVRVIFACALGGAASSLPLVAWNFVPIQLTERARLVDPVLAFARDSAVHFYHCGAVAGGADFKFYPLQRIELEEVLIAACWLNSRSFVVVDAVERVHLYEVASGERLESLDLAADAGVQLVYSSADFKGLATGQASEALSFAANSACYQSIVAMPGQIFVLSSKSVHAISARSWLERVDALAKGEDFAGAIQLALDFYEDKTGTNRTGAMARQQPRSRSMREIVARKLLELVEVFVQHAFTSAAPAANGRGTAEQLKTVVPLVFDTCVKLERDDFLFNEVYGAKFSESTDPTARAVFFECLEEYVLEGALHVDAMPPSLVQSFVAHLEAEGLFSSLESCVMRLNVATLDLHQVMSIARRNSLWDIVIHVHNRALLDYVTPLKEMFPLLQRAVKKELLTDEDIRLGNRIVLYVSCCLCGRAYPFGELPTEELSSVSLGRRISGDVFELLMSPTAPTSTDSETSAPYPYIRCLLQFDARETLNVFAMAFESDDFLFAVPTSVNGAALAAQSQSPSKIQRVIDVLVRIMLDARYFSTLQVGALFTFVCRLLVGRGSGGDVLVRRDQLHQLLEASLCISSAVDEGGNVVSCSLEKQQALLEVLESPVGRSMLDRRMVLALAERAKLYQVCEWLYWNELPPPMATSQYVRPFDKIIECYLNDPYRKEQTLALIRQLLAVGATSGVQSLSDPERALVRTKLLSAVQDLLVIDGRGVAELLCDFAPSSLRGVCDRLKSAGGDEQLFLLLHDVYEYRKSSGVSLTDDDDGLALVELFIASACTTHPSEVLGLLAEAGEAFWTESVLRICERLHVVDAAIFLLEKREKYAEAFEYLLRDLRTTDGVDERVRQTAIEFCRRNSDRVTVGERQTMWLSLLDTFLNARRAEKDAISAVVNAMVSYVDASILLQRLFENEAYKSGRYGEFAALLASMMKSYSFDEVLLSKSVSLVQRDCNETLRAWHASLRSPASRASDELRCAACCAPLDDPTIADGGEATKTRRLACFACNHRFHVECLRALDTTPDLRCFLCVTDVIEKSDEPATFIGAASARTAPLSAAAVEAKRQRQLQELRRGARATPSGFTPGSGGGLLLGGGAAKQRSSAGGIFDEERFRLRLAPPAPRGAR